MATNITYLGSFNGQRVIDEIIKKKDKKFKTYAAAVFRDSLRETADVILKNTPVGDFEPGHAGTTKANWQLTKGAPSGQQLNAKSPNRTAARLKIPRSFKALFEGGNWFFSNALPWIDKLEFGGYVPTPKKGTYNKKTGSWEIRTTGGFSKQAPQGMFRLGASQWPKFIRKYAKKHKPKARM